MGRPKKCRLSGKVKFKTFDRAIDRGTKVFANDPSVTEFGAYPCICGAWHLTTNMTVKLEKKKGIV